MLKMTTESQFWYAWGSTERMAAIGVTELNRDLPARQPSTSPVKPGTRRGTISHSPYEVDPDSRHFEVLDTLSQQGFRISERFMETLFAWWGPRPPLNVNLASDYRALGANKGKVLYTDVFFDYRLRVYTISGSWGSLQNSRLSRAAMEAPEPVSVSPEQWATIVPHFIHEGWETTPKAASAYLKTPSTDWMRIRACIAVLEYHETGKTAYLIEQDASCSGLQHMALIMRDRELAEKVNATITDERQDLYSYVAEVCSIGASLGLTDREARQWAKPVVMLTSYGSGAGGIADRYWADAGGIGEYDEEGKFQPDKDMVVTIGGKDLTYDELMDFVRPMQKALFNEFPAIKHLRNSCQDYFREAIEADPSQFCWTTPLGGECVRIILPSEQAAESVSSAGAMPNLIHSLDACVVQYVIVNYSHVLGVVHDAFFTTCDKAEELRQVVREAYAHVHADLGQFPVGNRDRTPLPIGTCIGV